jgi:hypothetical protein
MNNIGIGDRVRVRRWSLDLQTGRNRPVWVNGTVKMTSPRCVLVEPDPPRRGRFSVGKDEVVPIAPQSDSVGSL